MKQYLDQSGVEYLWGRIKHDFAKLDSDGRVPASQLPSYVDDVEEYSSLSSFPKEGEAGKIYVAMDSNLTYRWGGSTYVEISPSIALGETSTTAYPGDKGKQLATALQSEVSRATTAENDIRSTITAEQNRAQNSEQELSGLIEKNANDITKVSKALDDATSEITASLEAEKQSRIDADNAEKTERQSADDAIKADLNTEVSRAKAAEQEEATARSNADDAIKTSLNAEVSRAKAEEASLASSIAAETSRATAAESDLSSKIAAEKERAAGAEATITISLNSEISDRKQAVSDETTRATAAEEALDEKIDSIEIVKIDPSNSTTAASYQLHLNGKTKGATIDIAKDQSIKDIEVLDMNATLNGDGTIEAGSPVGTTALCISYILADGSYKLAKLDYSKFLEEAEFADGLIVKDHKVYVNIDSASEDFLTVSSNGVKLSGVQDAIDASTAAEKAARESVDTELKDLINSSKDTLTDALNSEIERAKGAESTITSNLNTEVTRAKTAEGTLQTNINNEAATRKSADDAINASVTAETTRAKAAEEANATAIATETTNRQNADTALQTALDTHKADTSNPHKVTKAQVGLDKVDNTADADKVVASADKLTTSRKIWGQEFDSTADVSGDITLDGNIIVPNGLTIQNESGSAVVVSPEGVSSSNGSIKFTTHPTDSTKNIIKATQDLARISDDGTEGLFVGATGITDLKEPSSTKVWTTDGSQMDFASKYLPLTFDSEQTISNNGNLLYIKNSAKKSFLTLNTGDLRAYYYTPEGRMCSDQLNYGLEVRGFNTAPDDPTSTDSDCSVFVRVKNVDGYDYVHPRILMFTKEGDAGNVETIRLGSKMIPSDPDSNDRYYGLQVNDMQLDQTYNNHVGINIASKTHKDIVSASWSTYHVGSESDTTEYTAVAPLGSDNKIPAQYLDIVDMLSYGVEWDITVSDPACTRIGNPLFHKSLPVQSQYKGCVVKDGEVKYFLDPNDWSKKADGTDSVLDGTDGDVMVRTPKFYGKSGSDGDKRWVRISTVQIDASWVEIPELYVSAYRNTIYTDTDNLTKVASVVNTTANYRGGGRRTAYDDYLSTDPFRTDLGKPVSNISRATMRTYAKNAGQELLCYEFYKWIFYWAYVIEYANFNSQAAYNAELTSDGYHQGGLGNGVTTWNWNNWTTYNSNNALTPCGYSNTIGNYTGTLDLVIPETTVGSTTVATKTLSVHRWRGFENPFGDIWTNLDGIVIKYNSTSGYNDVYTTTDASKFGDDTSVMSVAGSEITTSGYTKTFSLGETGEIIPFTVGGSQSTYKCDYHWVNQANGNTLGVGGHADNGSRAGLGYFDSSCGVGFADSAVGFRSVIRA